MNLITSKYLKFGMAFVVLLLIVSFSNFAQASTDNSVDDSSKDVFVSELPKEADFDLTKMEKQEVSYIDESGKMTTFGIEPVVEDTPTFSPFLCANNCTSPISKGNSTWKIYHYSGAINMSYRIKINRTGNVANITSVYDKSVTVIGYGLSDVYFGKRNSKKAEYSATATLAKYIPVSFDIWLIAEIDGTTLKTRAKS